VVVVHALFISVVLRSVPAGSSSEMDSLSDIFAQPLPMAAFSDLALALSPLQSSRRALVSAAKRLLNNSFQFHLLSSSQVVNWGMQNNYEKVKCGLIALFVLVCSVDWGDSEIEAWCLLSDLIVENRPALPLLARTWLFQKLNDSASKRQRLGSVTATHLLHACLARLLLFIGPDENGNASFLYDKVFVAWGGNDTKQVEDIAGLFQLTFALIHCLWSEDTSIQTVLVGCCTSLLLVIQDERDPMNQQRFAVLDNEGPPSSMPLPITGKTFPCYVAFYCLALALQTVSKDKLVLGGKEVLRFGAMKFY